MKGITEILSIENILNTPKRGGFRKIYRPENNKKQCQDKSHNPPGMICLKPGVYEYSCPSCGATQTVIIPEIKL